jgi:outer membrane protein OmpA-like peptidoglycan-associated protein
VSTARTSSTLLAATGLALGATAVGVGVDGSVASAGPGYSSACLDVAFLVSAGVCEVDFYSSTNWHAPAGVSHLQILAVGGGGGGGGGTTYGPGGGGGGGQVKVCSTSLVDLTGPLAITIGDGGDGGANGQANEGDPWVGGEYGVAGDDGTSTSVSDGTTLCAAVGGDGGAPGYNYETSQLPTTPFYGGGGASGSGQSGGSADDLVTASGCNVNGWSYNLTASGGGGDSADGAAPVESDSGAGGAGSVPSSGLFAGNSSAYGGGGGGGAGNDCNQATDISAGSGGVGGGGTGGSDVGFELTAPTGGSSFSGGGGGGGAGEYFTYNSSTNPHYGIGSAGGDGAMGFVEVRFARPSTTLKGAVYFATASSSLSSSDRAQLRTFVASALSQDELTVRVVGYTDPRGGAAYNQALSQSRANRTAAFVRRLFAADHVTADVTAVGRGEKHTYANLAKDRVATLTATRSASSGTPG